VRPTALVVLREDHELMLDALIPRPGQPFGDFMTPLARSLDVGGHSSGEDPALSDELGSGT
jgi:hypothetical protein